MRHFISFIVLTTTLVCNSYASRPTVNASNFTATNIQCNQVRLSWTNGDGASRIIIGRINKAPTFTPDDGNAYNQYPDFGVDKPTYPTSAPDSNFVLYDKGSTNFVVIDSLKPGTTYYFVIYENDNSGANTQYLITGAPVISATTHYINPDFSYFKLDSCQTTNQVTFTNKSTSSISGITYRFDFGNGTSTASPVTHHLGTSGDVNVKLYPATTVTGCMEKYKLPYYSRNVRIFPKSLSYIDYGTFVDTQCLEGNYYKIIPSVIIQPFPMGVAYKWWYGDGDSLGDNVMRHGYKKPGTYTVKFEVKATYKDKPTGCKDTVAFTITVLPNPVGSISFLDTFQCLKHNRYRFENTDNTLSSYKWYFGDTDSSDQQIAYHKYADTGVYNVIHVAYALSGCKGRDTFPIKVLKNLDSRFAGLDTFYCQSNKPVKLFPKMQIGSTWFDYPVSGDSLIPNTIGNHTLTHIVRDKYCKDTTTMTCRIAQTPIPDLGKDTAICSALSFKLDARVNTTSYLWNTGETTKTIVVYTSGKYKVNATIGNCSAEDSVNIIFSSPPSDDIGSDTILCKGGGMWLYASYPNATYLWNTGSTDSSIYAFNAGLYIVTITTPCGSFKDSIYINYAGEYCDLFMPNAFTPGNDWLNNVFMPRGRGITVQLFQIYNRWGELLFETNEDGVGWDGTYKGEIVQDGLYIWKLYYTTVNGPYIKRATRSGR